MPIDRKRKAEEPEQMQLPQSQNWVNSTGFNVNTRIPVQLLTKMPQVSVQPLQSTKPREVGSCVKHPVSDEYYLMLLADKDTLQSNEVVRKFTFQSTDDINAQNLQFNQIPAGVYNFILFSDLANNILTLHIMYMNPMEYYSKHKQLIFDSKSHVREEKFMYSGEIQFDGTSTIVANDISSLYFNSVKNDSINFAFQLLFPNMDEFINAMGPAGLQYYNSLGFAPGESIPPAGLKALLNRFYTKADYVGYLKEGVRSAIDNILQKMFTEFMQYALRMIFGERVNVEYSPQIYTVSSQQTLTKDFMDALCRVKQAEAYPPLYYDSSCSAAVANETWCTYNNIK